LSGLFTWFPAGFLGVLLGICFFVYTNTNLTPFSVSVRSYHRSDGSYVRAHNRRPPGSVEHDKPYKTLQYISFLFLLTGTAACGISVYRLVNLSDLDLLPAVDYKSKLPDKPRDINVPHILSKARSSWLCYICREAIRSGGSYYHYGSHHRTRICPQCRSKLIEDKRTEDRNMVAYKEALRKEETDKYALQLDMCKRFYGIQFEEANISHSEYNSKYNTDENYTIISKRLNLINDAIRNNNEIEFLYKKPDQSKYHQRRINPYEIISIPHTHSNGETICVKGYCFERNAERVFAIKRMRSLFELKMSCTYFG